MFKKYVKKSLLLLCILVIGGCLVLTGCANSGQTGGDADGDADVNTTPIKIGGIFPITGASADPGTGCKRAMELAIEEINAAGGVEGRPLVLIFEDDESIPATSVAAAEKLCVQDQVTGVIGAFNSSCVLAHMAVTGREEVPQIDPVAFAYAITRSGNPYMFRNVPQAEVLGNKFGEFMLKESGAKKWAFVYESTDYGNDYLKYIKGRVEAEPGVQIVATETYNMGDTDFYSQLTKIKNLGPEAICFIANQNEGAQLMKQVRELKIDVPLFATGSLATQDFRNLAGPAADGLYSLSFLEPVSDNPLVSGFLTNYEAKFKTVPDYFAAATYDAVYLMAEGLRNAYVANGNVWPEEGKALRDALKDGIAAIKDFNGVQGVVNFNKYGEAATDIYWVQWENGKKRVVQILPAAENTLE